MKLILFDIDGTLVDSGGAGTRALDLAFSEIFSINDAFAEISMAGKTDPQIIREGLSFHGIPSGNGIVPGVVASYIRHLQGQIKNSDKNLKPGIREALDAITAVGHSYSLGLLTGNVEQGAMIKLGVFDLNGYFPFGAFGSDDEDRNKLLPVAVERFRSLSGLEIGYKDCIIIGDTPRDTWCAKPYGALSIGVATGPYSADALEDAGADKVFDSLADTGSLLKALEVLTHKSQLL